MSEKRSGWHGGNAPAGATPMSRALEYAEERLASMDEPAEYERHIANGFKLALRELSEQEPETLRKFLMAVFEHLSDGAAKWAGRKLLAAVAAALFTAAIWLVASKR